METSKFYWLKLKRDFFKRHDIRIVESMPNGKEYILFYLKLLCESVDHEGALRFSESIPYNADMLATITETNVDTVKSAIQIFTELGMMEMLDDGTLYMLEVQKMIGSAVDTTGANRQRRYRERQKQLALEMPQETKRYAGVTQDATDSYESKRKSKSKRKEIDTDKFDEFWKAYPKKVGKIAAQRAFEKKCTSDKTFAEIIDGLNKVVELDWSTRETQYIPNPATWLNGERWKDEVKEVNRKVADVLPEYMNRAESSNSINDVSVSDIQKMIDGIGGRENGY